MKWILLEKEKPVAGSEILGIFKSEKDRMYIAYYPGWFRDVIYICKVEEEKIVLRGTYTKILLTHWMPLPEPPEDQ